MGLAMIFSRLPREEVAAGSARRSCLETNQVLDLQAAGDPPQVDE